MIISFNSNIYSDLLTLQNGPLACGWSELLIVNSHCPITSHGAVTTYHTTPVNKMLYENVYWVSNFMITGIRSSSTSTEITQDKGLLFSAMSQKSRWVNNGSFNLDDFNSKQTSYFRIIFSLLLLVLCKIHTDKLNIYTSSVVETKPTWRTFQTQAQNKKRFYSEKLLHISKKNFLILRDGCWPSLKWKMFYAPYTLGWMLI